MACFIGLPARKFCLIVARLACKTFVYGVNKKNRIVCIYTGIYSVSVFPASKCIVVVVLLCLNVW